MDRIVIKPLSGRGKDISYINDHNGKTVIWGQTHFFIPTALIAQITNDFFVDKENWYPLGADMVNPIPGGLGEYVRDNISSLSSRHATAIASIMHNENLIDYKNKKPILLKFKG